MRNNGHLGSGNGNPENGTFIHSFDLNIHYCSTRHDELYRFLSSQVAYITHTSRLFARCPYHTPSYRSAKTFRKSLIVLTSAGSLEVVNQDMVQVSLAVGSKGSILSVVEFTRGCMLQRGSPRIWGTMQDARGELESLG